MTIGHATIASVSVHVLLVVATIGIAGCPPAPNQIPPDASDAAPGPQPPPPPPSPTPGPLPSPWLGADASGDLADQVCAHLGAIGCPQLPSCPITIRTKQGSFTDFKPACLLAATTPQAAVACGSVHCPGAAAGSPSGGKK